MKRYLHKFTVEGIGVFPFDMLRYDCCYPLTSSDSLEMEPGRGKRRKVVLTREADRLWTPTVGRWSSFLWKVTDHTVDPS